MPRGYGSGDGSGDGSSYGSGDGYGSGYGSGYGDGYGYGYWKLVFNAYRRKVKPPKQSVTAFWWSTRDGGPANGGRSHTKAAVGVTEEVSGPLEICARGLHGTTNPSKWKGERLWLVALHKPVQKQEDKIVSLKRTILCEVR